MTIDAQRLDTIEKNAITVIGVPYDENSTYMQGAAGGPPKIREALHCGSANLCSEDDMEFAQSSAPLDAIQQFVGKLLEKEARVLVLGGDHAITPAVIRAYHEKFGRINVLHFDAHPDLYESFEGNRDSHACPFARIMEEKLAKRLVQVGIRTMNPHQQNQAEKFGVEVVDMQSWRPGMRFDFSGPLYISLDMDALDPAFAPGVSHHEPGGLSTRDLLTMIQAIDVPVIGADIVEFNPLRDVSGMTAMVAAKLMKELASKMLND